MAHSDKRRARMLIAKAKGMAAAIRDLQGPERTRTPTGAFAADYNRLRHNAAELLKDVEDLLPPTVRTFEDGMVEQWSEAPYQEILSYCEQLAQLLDEDDPIG